MSDRLHLAEVKPDALEAVERAIPDLADLTVTPELLARLAHAHGRLGALLAGAAGLAMTRAARPAPPAEPERYLSVRDAAKAIGMSEDYVRDHRAELGCIDRGRALRFPLSALRRATIGPRR